MHNKPKIRQYQKKQIGEDLYQFEMGNELGAQLERNKQLHEETYKEKVMQAHQNKMSSQNESK